MTILFTLARNRAAVVSAPGAAPAVGVSAENMPFCLQLPDIHALAVLAVLGLPEEACGRCHGTRALKALGVLRTDIEQCSATELSEASWPTQKRLVECGLPPHLVPRIVGVLITIAQAACKREEPVVWRPVHTSTSPLDPRGPK